jgi:hypothetical protein
MATKKKVTAKKVAPKKVAPKKVDKYDQITSSVVNGVTVYSYKDYTSISLDKIKRYVD